jgi:two-component system nitrogen regulation response regulator GlnG
LTAIEHLRRRVGEVPIIVITAYGDLRTAVEAVRNGAFEYIVKPFDLDRVQQAVTRALEMKRPDDAPRRAAVDYVGGLCGKTPAMQEVFKRLALAAASEASVLLGGESGTGKELAARAIHQYGTRAQGAFVAVNVAALSETLAESELFGHVRGAFTGADQARDGLLVQADGGTLFLDEVADIPLPAQVKLLRALEHGEVVPVGSNDPVKTNFRVVSATHQNLLDKVREGTFRHDLYFRLRAFQIDLPPLRARREDIPELAEHFLDRLCQTPAAPRPQVSPEALAELERRPWHGNVRELRNAMEHAVILARGGILTPDHLPPPIDSTAIQPRAHDSTENRLAALIAQWAAARLENPERAADLHEQLLQLVEPPLFRAALDANANQVAAAARKLGLHRVTLRKKLDQYGIEP